MIKEFREWASEKLNPAQPTIASDEGTNVSPVNIRDWKSAYNEIEVIHRAVEIVISACVEVPYLVDGGPSKKINKLINVRPNPFEDRISFFRRALLDFHLDGNVFFYYDSKEDEGDSLYILPANDVTILPDEKTYIKGYEYGPSSGSAEIVPGFFTSRPKDKDKKTVIFTPREIIHVKNDSNRSIYRGDSKLQSLDRLINLYNAMISFQSQFFINNAVPGFVLSTNNVLSKKVKDRMLEQWKMSYSSFYRGARKPAILDGGLKIDKFSEVKFNELDFEASIERIQMDMSKALGVPYVLLKSGNNANITPNQTLFYQHTVIPILEQFASAFQHGFGPDVKIKPDVKAIMALRSDIKARSEFWSSLVNNGIATAAEARADLNLPIMKGKDVNDIRIPQNIVGSATNSSQGGRPSGGKKPAGTSTTENNKE